MQSPSLYIDPHLLPFPEQLHAWLRKEVQWDERMKARKTASFGVAYNYSQIAYQATPMPAALDAICAMIEQAIGFRPNNCLINYYADGAASMGFHSDETAFLMPGTGVAIMSLGSERSIVFRNKLDRTLDIAYMLQSGSLLYMPQQVQHDWLHAIPKAVGVGERISLTFRAMQDGLEVG